MSGAGQGGGVIFSTILYTSPCSHGKKASSQLIAWEITPPSHIVEPAQATFDPRFYAS